MTKKNSFVYFDDAVVTRRKKLYDVFLEREEVTIVWRESTIDSIASKTGEDESLIAILISYIELVRISTAKKDRIPAGLPSDVIEEGLIVLLRHISIDELIFKFRSLKWHEIKDVLTAKSPLDKINNLYTDESET